MPWISSPDPSDTAAADPASDERGWTARYWAGAKAFGEPVPLEVRRYRVAANAQMPLRCIPLAGTEAMAYVIAGSGTAVTAPPGDGERFSLGAESVLWLSAAEGLSLGAGPGGLDVLVAQSTGPAPGDGFASLRKVFAAAELPHLMSTRDTRDRLDLVTENVPVGARAIRADRIVYHPGDTAAAHYHTDCHHVFCVLAGSGLLYDGEHAHRLGAGDCALVGPGELHWFENDTGENFSFVEFWAPPPAETIWTVTGDRCTWAPAG
jgi:mannose-6-phosphate isomerase-like protein (cupin superfamily)